MAIQKKWLFKIVTRIIIIPSHIFEETNQTNPEGFATTHWWSVYFGDAVEDVIGYDWILQIDHALTMSDP